MARRTVSDAGARIRAEVLALFSPISTDFIDIVTELLINALDGLIARFVSGVSRSIAIVIETIDTELLDPWMDGAQCIVAILSATGGVHVAV